MKRHQRGLVNRARAVGRGRLCAGDRQAGIVEWANIG